jgi:hypothetical protein
MRHRVLPIPFVVLNSVAWRHLNAFAKAAFIDIAACYDGTNNGWLKIPDDELARVLCTTRRRAMRALEDLERARLLERFGWDEYRLTCFYCNRTGAAPAVDPFWRGNRSA